MQQNGQLLKMNSQPVNHKHKTLLNTKKKTSVNWNAYIIITFGK